MKKRLINLALIVAFSLISAFTFAQNTVKGTVVDAKSGESLVGATIVIEGLAGTGTVADYDGNFSLSVPTGKQTLVINFVGYTAKKVEVTSTKDLGQIKMEESAIGIDEIRVIASVAVDRQTPIAVSTVTPVIISEKLGIKEFPEILASTPSVYATKRGGAFGDSRINLRGFASANIAVMINGVPVNDMEWGGIYWSNWAGLADVTRSMQVQRGLGASKIAVPSVGGSINVLTNTTDAKKGGIVSTRIGSGGYQKVSFSVSTGLTENNWAVTLLGAQTKGDGYILGTEFEAYSYFLNISKRLNDKHLISLTGFGAPQWHNQRSSYDMQTIAGWQTYKEGYRYNATYGFGTDGVRKTSAMNYYHKPQFSLNHYWTVNNSTSLSTAAYYSFGTGGGHSARGNNSSSLYGSSNYRTIEGYLDYTTIMEENAENINGSQAIIGSSNNNHKWYGVISNLNKDFSTNLNFSGGLDLRYYIGEHNRTVKDLLGGNFFIDGSRESVSFMADDYNYINEKLYVGDKISRDYYGHVLWSGTFGQLEYRLDKLSTFVSAAVSNTTYWRVDEMYYEEAEKESEKISFIGYSIKGGANYNLTAIHNVFTNVGYFSRAPFFSTVFTAKDVSNIINPKAINEEVFSAELGYGLRTTLLSLNLNFYNTVWNNKTLYGTIDSQNPDAGTYNAQGVNAIHRGIELDFVLKPTSKLSIKGMASIGDWRWDDDVEAYAYNKDGHAVSSSGAVVDPLSDAHYKTELKIADVHVGDAAQTTAFLGIDYELFHGFKLGLDMKYFSRLFSDPGNISYLQGDDTWQVPDYYTLDADVRYKFKFAGLKSTLYFNLDNLLDDEYIVDARNGSSNEWDTATVFYGFGRTWSLGLKINF